MWTPFPLKPSCDPSSLHSARVLTHWVAQVVAAAGNTLIEAQADFAHTTLRWDNRNRVLTGQSLNQSLHEGAPKSPSIRAGLHIRNLEFVVLRDSALEASFSLPGQTLTAAMQWLAKALAEALEKPVVPLQRPEHDLPEPAFSEHQGDKVTIPASAIQDYTPALATLEQWLANADQLLTRLVTIHNTNDATETSPLRIWPHHFDMATLLRVETPPETPQGEGGRSIGVGLSLGDSSYDQPYWYVTPWPYPDASSINEALPYGHWHRDGFVAAILESSELTQAGVEGQGLRSEQFLREAIAACFRILARKTMANPTKSLLWYKAADLQELPEGRVKSLSAGLQTICLTHHKGCYAALNNACPHQGGPLGEGSIEKGWLRCPWHGWDFDPLTGKSPAGLEDGLDTYPVELRDDGIYVGLQPSPEHTRTATDVMAETMIDWGVKWVFGMVGHSNLGLADALRRQVEAGRLGYIGIRHEGAASFAVSAYGKLTGRPAACLAIAGPGATNLLTGLWDANVDRAPALALTGQVQSQVLGRGAFQEIDLKAAYGGVAQWTASVLHDSPFAELMALACKHAILGRGVSHLIFPDEVQTKAVSPKMKSNTPEGRMPDLDIAPSTASLEAAEQAIRSAKRPVIIVGHGARFAMEAITSFANDQSIPIITTFKGKGLISDGHPLAGGVLGRSGTPVASWLMNEADLLIVLGASFSNHTGITAYKTIVQVDYEAEALGRRHKVKVPVLGEIGITIGLLQERLGTKKNNHARPDPRPEVAERWQIWRSEKKSRLTDDRDQGLNSATIFAALSRLAPPDAIIAVDVGNNAYSFGRYFEVQQQSILMSGYLGSIGFALPAAMGAWMATQENDPRFAGRKVISVSGDGGLGQYLADLSTWVKYGMNITHVVLNNGELGKISKEQRSGHWQVWETSLCNPSFSEFAENCGALGLQVSQASELDEALQHALAHSGPSLVEIKADASLF